MRYILCLVAMLFTPVGAAYASSIKENIEIVNAWAKPTISNMMVSSAYLTISNVGQEDAEVVAVKSLAAANVQVHTMVIEGDIARMRALPVLEIPGGEEVVMSPGGVHIMLMGLKKPLKPGDIMPITLVFRGGEEFSVEAMVK